jgi:hypothetical protein
MRRRTSVLLVVSLLALIAIIALSRPTSPIAVDVSLVIFTNDASGQRCMRFGITNISAFTIRRWGYFTLEDHVGSAPSATFTFGAHALLRSGQSEILSVPMVHHKGTWRAVFSFSREGLRTKLYDYSMGWPGLQARLGIPREHVWSGWITP